MAKFKKVEDVDHPLKKGEEYLVPCIVRQEDEIIFITPVLNHPHNDVENGQREPHYHADYRFIKFKNVPGNSIYEFPAIALNKHRRYSIVCNIARVEIKKHGSLEYFILPVINESFTGITSPKAISNSKLKHKCIHKGKCPHRGYNLAQVPAKDGVITCPLHGLEFDSITGKLLNKQLNG